MNNHLVREVVRSLNGVEQIADFYCGSGNFTLLLGRQGARVLGIETSDSRLESVIVLFIYPLSRHLSAAESGFEYNIIMHPFSCGSLCVSGLLRMDLTQLFLIMKLQ